MTWVDPILNYVVHKQFEKRPCSSASDALLFWLKETPLIDLDRDNEHRRLHVTIMMHQIRQMVYLLRNEEHDC